MEISKGISVSKMQAVQVHQFGGAETLSFQDEVPVPTIGREDILVRNRFSGVNFKDTLCRAGRYHGGNPTLPFVPGIEAAGTVVMVGDLVKDFKIGDKVAYMTGGMDSTTNDCYAEFTKVHKKSHIVSVPGDIPLDIACTLMVQGLTAHYLSNDCFPVKSGHSVLVHGAGGGLGQILVQLCKIKGAKVYGTAGSQGKLDAGYAMGADGMINYRERDFCQELQIYDTQGVDAVFDGIGKRTFLKGLDVLKTRGTMILYGNACGEAPDHIHPNLLAQKGSLTLIRPSLYDYLRDQQEMQQRASDLFSLYQAGKLTIKNLLKLPLNQAEDAHNLLLSRRFPGKILFEI